MSGSCLDECVGLLLVGADYYYSRSYIHSYWELVNPIAWPCARSFDGWEYLGQSGGIDNGAEEKG